MVRRDGLRGVAMHHSHDRVWYFTVQLADSAAVCTRGRAVHKPQIRLLSQHSTKVVVSKQIVAL